MVDHMGSATENKMEPTILNGKGGDVFVWEEGVHGTSSKSLLNWKKNDRDDNTQKQIEKPKKNFMVWCIFQQTIFRHF